MTTRANRWSLWLILAASLGLRIWLAAGGGQGYWPDENTRYGDSQKAASHLLGGEWAGMGRELLGHADHLLFRWMALPPALLDELLGVSAFRAACYFSIFSVAAIGLIWGIVRRTGGSEEEALLAAGLAACTNSLFFYARHFFPYDAALALVLLGLWVGMGGRQAWRVWTAGVIVGAGFLTYNGCWLMGGVVLAVVTLPGGHGWRHHAGRMLLAGTGVLGSIGGMVLLARLAGFDLLSLWRENATTITQGDFGQGWRMIAEYLWSADGPLAVIWFAALAGGAWLCWRERDAALLRWLGAVALLVAGLIALSDCAHKFVVYGRLVRPLVPFLCLLTARVAVVGIGRQGWPGWMRPGLLTVALGCAVWNFAGPLRQVFPEEFLPRARAEIRRLLQTQPGTFRLVRAEHLWGVDVKTPLPPHEVLLSAAHPLQFRPYQYEGFSTEQRTAFAEHDIAMQLIRLNGTDLQLVHGPADPVFGAYLGPVRLIVRFLPGVTGRAEPLITTGRNRQGDFLFVRNEDAAHVRFGFDHWGSGGVMTGPIPFDYAQEHELTVSLGSLMPGADAECYRTKPWLARLRRLVFVALDGQPVLLAWSNFFSAEPEDVAITSNYIGGTSVLQSYSGQLANLTRAPLDELARLLPFARLTINERGADWLGAPGPWSLRLRLPPAGDRAAEPLYSAWIGGQSEALLLERLAEGRVRLRLERNGAVFRTESFEVDPAQAQEVRFSTGVLYPEEASPFFRDHPHWRQLKRLACVTWNGRIVLLHNFEPLPGRVSEAALATKLVPEVSAREYFSGQVEAMAPEDPERILRTGTQLANMIEPRTADWAGYPGPVRLRLRLPREVPVDGVGEPLLVGGIPGAGDFLAVLHEADGRVRFSFDHWGASSLPVSAPVRIEPGEECEILISAGFLWPPSDAPLYQANPALQDLRQRVIVAVNGQLVLDAAAESHASTPEQLTVGINFIGGSTTRASFGGIIEKIQRADPAELNRALGR